MAADPPGAPDMCIPKPPAPAVPTAAALGAGATCIAAAPPPAPAPAGTPANCCGSSMYEYIGAALEPLAFALDIALDVALGLGTAIARASKPLKACSC